MPKLMKGSEIFFEVLRREHVDTIFGYPGGAVLPIYDKMYDVKDIKHVLVRHEQGAIHMAEGYAKASGKTGVVLVTSGPGATNTVTGIADAYMDAIPVVIFTGQVPTAVIGLDAFQEADIIGITRPITKWNCVVRDVSDLAETIVKAFKIARSGKPGPVLVDLPKDVMNSSCEFRYPKPQESVKLASNFLQMADFITALEKSKKPLIYVGGGVVSAKAEQELFRFTQKYIAPVTTTLHGLGAFPSGHELSLGMLGMHGQYAANRATDECDLLISFGARFDDRVTGKTEEFAKNAYRMQVDIDPSNANKAVYVDIYIQADLKEFLSELNKQLKKRKDFKGWLDETRIWKNYAEKEVERETAEILTASMVLKKWSSRIDENITVVTDVGQNQMWTAQIFPFSRIGQHISSGGMGTMGFSVPAAIGAAFARETDKVISINGDGGFQMNMQELITASYNRLPIIFIILNNESLGMVRQWQDLFHAKRFSYIDLSQSNPDFIKLSESMGVVSKKVESVRDVEESIDWALSYKSGPCLIEYRIMKEEMVFPMIPSGATVKEMVLNRLSFENE
jgi:acetolactate synthase I/II/III large subunit